MKSMFWYLASATAFGLASTAATAQSFDGTTVNYQYYYADLSSPYGNASNGDYLIGPGVEISNVADSTATMDISGTNILVDFGIETSWNPAAFNGWVLSDTSNNLAAILGVTINGATNMAGFSSSNISFTGDSIFVNWQGLGFDENTVVSLDVTFADSGVPEPATWAMMLLGFGAMGLALRRSRKRLQAAPRLA